MLPFVEGLPSLLVTSGPILASPLHFSCAPKVYLKYTYSWYTFIYFAWENLEQQVLYQSYSAPSFFPLKFILQSNGVKLCLHLMSAATVSLTYYVTHVIHLSWFLQVRLGKNNSDTGVTHILQLQLIKFYLLWVSENKRERKRKSLKAKKKWLCMWNKAVLLYF